jgi:Carboxypeptidase regulatory-like domain
MRPGSPSRNRECAAPRILAEMNRSNKLIGLLNAGALAVCCAIVASGGVFSPGIAIAQGAAQRVVQGRVVDKQDAGIKGAVVYLKDDHSLQVKSFFSGDDGSYRFAQLAQNVDYELWAESDGKKSAVKTISSFNTKEQFNINLKIEK